MLLFTISSCCLGIVKPVTHNLRRRVGKMPRSMHQGSHSAWRCRTPNDSRMRWRVGPRPRPLLGLPSLFDEIIAYSRRCNTASGTNDEVSVNDACQNTLHQQKELNDRVHGRTRTLHTELHFALFVYVQLPPTPLQINTKLYLLV